MKWWWDVIYFLSHLVIHQLEIDDRDSQIPLIQVVQYSGDYLLVVGTVTDFGISGVVGWDADQPQQLLGLLRGQHVVQQCPLLQKIFRDLKATIVNPFLNADLKNGQIVFQKNLLCFCLKNTIKMSNVRNSNFKSQFYKANTLPSCNNQWPKWEKGWAREHSFTFTTEMMISTSCTKTFCC